MMVLLFEAMKQNTHKNHCIKWTRLIIVHKKAVWLFLIVDFFSKTNKIISSNLLMRWENGKKLCKIR